MTSPDRIGRYRIVRELGRGGFATVYLAEDRSLDAEVAVKVLSDHFSADPDIVSRFIIEARVLRNLAAPGVVAVHDSGEHEGRPYFVMEYCDRGAIAGRIESLGRPLTIDEGLGLARAIGTALVGVHRGDPPIVHRDLKPENLLLRRTPRHRRKPIGELVAEDEQVIVGDFGLAKVANPEATSLTRIAYTEGYAAPEQSRGDPSIGPPVDVFAASAVIVSVIAGVRPRQVRGPDNHAFDPAALDTTGPLRAELERGLAYAPHHRHVDIGAWAGALDQAAANGNRVPGLLGRPVGGHGRPPHPATQNSPSAPPNGGSGSAPSPHLRLPASIGGAPRQLAVAPPPVLPRPRYGGPPPSSPHPPPLRSGNGVPAPPRQPRRRRLLPLVAVVVLAALAGGAFLLAGRTGSTAAIVGPAVAVVGDEIVFLAEDDVEVTGWTVGDQRAEGEMLVLRPVVPGSVTIMVATPDGETEFGINVVERSSSLTIEGPGLLPIGESIVLSATGGDGSALSWEVDGSSVTAETVELRPLAGGVLAVSVSNAGGERAERVFTVGDTSP